MHRHVPVLEDEAGVVMVLAYIDEKHDTSINVGNEEVLCECNQCKVTSKAFKVVNRKREIAKQGDQL